MKYLEIFERFYNPPREVDDKLKKIIADIISSGKKGRDFFDALDSSIKDITNKDMILALVRGNKNEWVATSGGFGDALYKLWENGEFECKGIVVFNGKMLTKKLGVKHWYPIDFDLNNKDFVYVDDSLFSGSTSNKIDTFLREIGSKIKSISVIYDGSKEKNKMVRSFFRYYK